MEELTRTSYVVCRYVAQTNPVPEVDKEVVTIEYDTGFINVGTVDESKEVYDESRAFVSLPPF